jgi:hypothetical protein
MTRARYARPVRRSYETDGAVSSIEHREAREPWPARVPSHPCRGCGQPNHRAGQAYEALTGRELTVEITGSQPWTGPVDLGEDWDFEDAAEMRQRYPRLWALYGWDEASSASP